MHLEVVLLLAALAAPLVALAASVRPSPLTAWAGRVCAALAAATVAYVLLLAWAARQRSAEGLPADDSGVLIALAAIAVTIGGVNALAWVVTVARAQRVRRPVRNR